MFGLRPFHDIYVCLVDFILADGLIYCIPVVFLLTDKKKKFKIILDAGMAKRPMGFPAQNFVQGQVSAAAPGTPGGGPGPQLQSSQAMTHAGDALSPTNTTLCGFDNFVFEAKQKKNF